MPKGLDPLLEYFGLERRIPGAIHDAYVDCVKAAELYMKLNPKKTWRKVAAKKSTTQVNQVDQQEDESQDRSYDSENEPKVEPKPKKK